jgi:hypothetical protein
MMGSAFLQHLGFAGNLENRMKNGDCFVATAVFLPNRN